MLLWLTSLRLSFHIAVAAEAAGTLLAGSESSSPTPICEGAVDISAAELQASLNHMCSPSVLAVSLLSAAAGAFATLSASVLWRCCCPGAAVVASGVEMHLGPKKTEQEKDRLARGRAASIMSCPLGFGTRSPKTGQSISDRATPTTTCPLGFGTRSLPAAATLGADLNSKSLASARGGCPLGFGPSLGATRRPNAGGATAADILLANDTATHDGPGPLTMLLTGASRGIGHGTVKLFARAGWRVITCSRTPFDPEGKCPWTGGSINHVQVDLADPDDTRALPK